MINCPSIDELTWRTKELNDTIFSIKLHFSNLDDKLHKRGSIRVSDVADELWIDVLDEEKDLFYCTTFEETMTNAIKEDSKQNVLWFDSITGYRFRASEEDIKKIMDNEKKILKNYAPTACSLVDFMKALNLPKEATYGDLVEAFARYKDKVKLKEGFETIIDIFNTQKFLSVGQFAEAFDFECDNEYDYYIGDKKLYREWLSKLLEGCFKVMMDSGNLQVICSAIADREKIKKAIDKFDAENND